MSKSPEDMTKRKFVATVLSGCLQAACPDVVSCEYEAIDKYPYEVVHVTYKNGYEIGVNVWGDSKVAIVEDVFKAACK